MPGAPVSTVRNKRATDARFRSGIVSSSSGSFCVGPSTNHHERYATLRGSPMAAATALYRGYLLRFGSGAGG